MIADIDSLNPDTLPLFIDWLLIAKQNPAQLESVLGEKIMQNGFGTFWFKPENPIFITFSLHYDNAQIVSSEIIGTFDLTFQHLQEKYGAFSTHYSHYDDLYFHSFNAPNCYLTYRSEVDCSKISEPCTHLIRVLSIGFK
jgi:hypothetical protein